MANPTTHSQSNFPNIPGSPVVDNNGALSDTWAAFFRALWVKCGSGLSDTGTAVYLAQDTSGNVVAYKAIDGTRIGKVTIT